MISITKTLNENKDRCAFSLHVPHGNSNQMLTFDLNQIGNLLTITLHVGTGSVLGIMPCFHKTQLKAQNAIKLPDKHSKREKMKQEVGVPLTDGASDGDGKQKPN